MDKRTAIRRIIEDLLCSIIVFILIYLACASLVFLWRNPKCNEIGVFRHLWRVILLEKMEKYQ